MNITVDGERFVPLRDMVERELSRLMKGEFLKTATLAKKIGVKGKSLRESQFKSEFSVYSTEMNSLLWGSKTTLKEYNEQIKG